MWNVYDTYKPQVGDLCTVIFADGVEGQNYKWRGKIFLAEDGYYRYVKPVFWKAVLCVGGQDNNDDPSKEK